MDNPFYCRPKIYSYTQNIQQMSVHTSYLHNVYNLSAHKKFHLIALTVCGDSTNNVSNKQN